MNGQRSDCALRFNASIGSADENTVGPALKTYRQGILSLFSTSETLLMGGKVRHSWGTARSQQARTASPYGTCSSRQSAMSPYHGREKSGSEDVADGVLQVEETKSQGSLVYGNRRTTWD